KGWHTTSIESAVRIDNGAPDPPPAHHITVTYVDPAADNARRYCPTSITDDLGRTVTFDCQGSTAEGVVVDGGVVRSVTVPAPHGGTLTYRLDHDVERICDPLSNDNNGCTLKPPVLLLSAVTAEGVVPEHRYQFVY